MDRLPNHLRYKLTLGAIGTALYALWRAITWGCGW